MYAFPPFNSAIAFITICSLSKPRFCSVKAFSLGKRVFYFVSDVLALFSTYRENMSPAKEQKRQPIENVAFKGEITFSERTSEIAKAITLYRTKTSLAKPKTFPPSLNFDRKGENAFI